MPGSMGAIGSPTFQKSYKHSLCSNSVGAAVRNSFTQAVATGHGEDYVPMLSDWVAEWNGASLAPKAGE